jgi:hypothetical protein
MLQDVAGRSFALVKRCPYADGGRATSSPLSMAGDPDQPICPGHAHFSAPRGNRTPNPLIKRSQRRTRSGRSCTCKGANGAPWTTTDLTALPAYSARETSGFLSQTRSAICSTCDPSACNIGVVREESGPTDTGCARGLLPTGDSSQCGGYAQVPAPGLCGTAGGIASSNIPDPCDRQGRRDSLRGGD